MTRRDEQWTADLIKEHFDDVLDEMKTGFEQRFQAQEAATVYAREVTNEFRGTLEDQATHQLPRGEADSRFAALTKRIDENRESVSKLGERVGSMESHSRGMADSWGYLVGAIGVAIAIASLLLK